MKFAANIGDENLVNHRNTILNSQCSKKSSVSTLDENALLEAFMASDSDDCNHENTQMSEEIIVCLFVPRNLRLSRCFIP